MLWIVGVINAMNLIDGLDGLAGGVALVAVITTFLVSVQRGHPLMMLFSSALAGAIIGFLFYNFNPASIFMGDTGSMFLGFVLAATAIQTNQKASTAVAVLIPAIALGLPIMDTLLAIGAARAARPAAVPGRQGAHPPPLDGRGPQPSAGRAGALRLLHVCSGAPRCILTYASSGQSALLLVVLALVAFVFLRSLGYMRLDRDAGIGRRSQAQPRACGPPSGRSAGGCGSCGGPTEMWPHRRRGRHGAGRRRGDIARGSCRKCPDDHAFDIQPRRTQRRTDDGDSASGSSSRGARRPSEPWSWAGPTAARRWTATPRSPWTSSASILGEALDLARAASNPRQSTPRPLPRV